MSSRGWKGRGCLALALAGINVPALCETTAPADGWGVSAGVFHRRLQERTDTGARFVSESGPMLRLALDRELRGADGSALRIEAAAASGDLAYESPTQGLTGRSGERDLALGGAWQPVAPGRWGAPSLVLQALQQRRQIASSTAAIGPRETSTLLMAGVRWTASFDAAGWRWSPCVEARVSVRHHLDVDLHGVFDATSFEAGRRRDLRLALGVARAGSPWALDVAWTGTRQSASDWHPLYQHGVPAGSVRHPRIEMTDFGLTLSRVF